MHRFFADERGIVDHTAYLSAQDAQHALRVLRLVSGDVIELVSPPARYRAEIVQGGDEGVSVQILEALPDTEARTQVTLYQGLPKADKMEWIVQKSTELGVHAIAPIAMARSVVRLSDKDAQKKAERWQKIAREAVKQCARIYAPQVNPVRTLHAALDELGALDLLIVPWEDAVSGSIADCLAPFADQAELNVGILIGPEGGIDAAEIQLLQEQAGAKLVTLGPRILRTETAALAAQTMVMALRAEMQ